jgi:hypothetical protein
LLGIQGGGVDVSSIQQRDARKLLNFISSALEKHEDLTYGKAALLMRRLPPQNHSRAIAHMCNLLDAAACLAGIPLLALVVVHDKAGKINPKAWNGKYSTWREAIISRSLNYQFGRADFDAISRAINDLGSRGDINAWKYLEDLYPGDLLYRRLTGTYTDTQSNAINDIGTDAPDRTKLEVWSYARDPRVRDAVLRRAKGKCESCGKLGFMKPDGTRYLEAHHIIALAKDGADMPTNVIALCPNLLHS